MAEKAEREKNALKTLYIELNRYGQNGEYERAIKTTNKILNITPQDSIAFHYKTVCLIELSKFDEANNLFKQYPQNASSLIFERSYCLYRANKHDEALTLIDSVGVNEQTQIDPRLKELKAQILYRIEDYSGATAIYRDIIKNTSDEYEDERLTNLSASIVHTSRQGQGLKIDDLDTDKTYELCYNKACYLIENGQFVDAEKKLKQCEKLCRDMLEEEEASEEEIDVDLSLIRIQLAYVYQKQGRVKEAQQLYIDTLKIKIEDIALAAVASNNLVCINKDQHLFDSKKKIKVALNEQLAFKLPSKQRKYIALNNAILNYYIRQVDQCEKLCKQIEKAWPDLFKFTIVLRALNLVKGNDVRDAIALLENHLDNLQKPDELYVKLCLTQLYLVQGDKAKACEILENLSDDGCYKPGIVGALTTLYLGLNEEKKALGVFQRSVEWYKKNKVEEEVNLTSMWRQAADFHSKNGHPEVAANCLEELLKEDRNDRRIIAQLVLACTEFNRVRAIELSAQLPSVESLQSDIDLESLLAAPSVSALIKKSPSAKLDTHGTPKSGDVVKKRVHKKRKGKLPKNYSAEVKPDPERWLPKYERTGYRKKRDRRVKDVIKGSQGTASGQAEQYDFSSKVAEQHETEHSAIVEPSPRTRVPPKKQQGKKKNKRR